MGSFGLLFLDSPEGDQSAARVQGTYSSVLEQRLELWRREGRENRVWGSGARESQMGVHVSRVTLSV